MPSLTYIKRLSQEQPTIKVTRVGVSKARQRAKARFGEDSVIRFSLHKRIKRTIDNAGGQVYVKISYYASSIKQKKTAMETHAKLSGIGLIRKSSLLRMDPQTQHQLNSNKSDQERIDKLVAISTTTKISELTQIALEKFHLPKDEEDTSYCMTLSVSGKGKNKKKIASHFFSTIIINVGHLEKNLPPERTLLDIINDTEMIPKGTIEKLFVLQKISNAKMQNSTGEIDGNSTNGSRFVRYLLKQDNASNSKPVQNNTEDISSTGNVLKRLDEAILSLENDKRKLDKVCSDEVKLNINFSVVWMADFPKKNRTFHYLQLY
jgi:hypothetical protein